MEATFGTFSCPEDFGKMCGCKDHEEYHSLRLKNQELNYNSCAGHLRKLLLLFVCLFVFLGPEVFFLCVSLSFSIRRFTRVFLRWNTLTPTSSEVFGEKRAKAPGSTRRLEFFRRVFVETPGATWSSRSFLLLWGRARVEVAVRTLADMLFVAAEKLKNLQCSKKKKVDKVEIVESWPATPPASYCMSPVSHWHEMNVLRCQVAVLLLGVFLIPAATRCSKS